jgi:FkbM family methyltransferase
VKIRELGHLLGWRPAPRTYGFEIRRFVLPADGTVEYAQWLHPRESVKVIRQEVVDELRTFIRPGDVAIDVGAHTGDSTVPVALAAGPEGRVLALEPNPFVFPILERNAALNRDRTAILPLNFAATPMAGEYEFEYSDAGFCNGGRHDGISRWRHGHAFTLTVKGDNLDRYLRRVHPELVGRVRYIKVDAEGADLEVLRSIQPLLEETRPFIRAEVYKWSSAARRRALAEFLQTLGYDVRRIVDEVTYRGPAVTPADLDGHEQFDVFAVHTAAS